MKKLTVISLALFTSQFLTQIGMGIKAPELPGGLVFPGITEAIRQNAAIIPKYATQSMQLFMTPAIDGNGTRFRRWGLGYTKANEKGVGYGFSYRSEGSSNSIYGAIGLKIEGVSVGLMLHEEALEKGFSPHADVGISVSLGPQLSMGFILEELNLRPKLGFGLGMQTIDKRFAFEGSFRTPESGSEDERESQNYALHLDSKANFGDIGIGYGFEYLTVDRTWTHQFTVLGRVSEKLSLMAQIESPLNYQFITSYQF